MDNVQIVHGSPMEYAWNSDGLSMEYERTIDEIPMDYPWESLSIHLLPMDYPWNIDGLPWIIHGLSTDRDRMGTRGDVSASGGKEGVTRGNRRGWREEAMKLN